MDNYWIWWLPTIYPNECFIKYVVCNSVITTIPTWVWSSPFPAWELSGHGRRQLLCKILLPITCCCTTVLPSCDGTKIYPMLMQDSGSTAGVSSNQSHAREVAMLSDRTISHSKPWYPSAVISWLIHPISAVVLNDFDALVGPFCLSDSLRHLMSTRVTLGWTAYSEVWPTVRTSPRKQWYRERTRRMSPTFCLFLHRWNSSWDPRCCHPLDG